MLKPIKCLYKSVKYFVKRVANAWWFYHTLHNSLVTAWRKSAVVLP